MNISIENRKANHNYFILDTLECGIELFGHEVKSIREGMCNIKDSYCYIKDSQLFLTGVHISKYRTAMDFDIDENRDRRLLAHKQEIKSFSKTIIDSGITLIPLKIYDVNGRIKVLVGVCKGKKLYDKRQSLKEKQIKRDIERAIKI